MTNPTPKEPTRVDYLDEDIIRCGDLQYALISFVSKNGTQRLEEDGKLGLKIRGAFATKDEANAHIKRLQKTDTMFDIYLVDMYSWLLLPPDNDKIADVHYQEEYLNDMVREYRESQVLAKQHFQERKRLIMEQGLDKNLLPEEILPPPPTDTLETDVNPSTREWGAAASSSST